MPETKVRARKAPIDPAPQPATFNFHFTRVSGNQKAGLIPVTTTSENSCPPNCSFKKNDCYVSTPI